MSAFLSSPSLEAAIHSQTESSASRPPVFSHSPLEPQAQATASIECFTLSITEDDFYWSQRSGLGNPILCALQRHTQTLWRLYDDGFALEAMPPYRACQLPPEMLQQWRRWQITGQLEARQWNLELVATGDCDCYSLIKNRHTNIREKSVLQNFDSTLCMDGNPNRA
jgi:hypothetical protein